MPQDELWAASARAVGLRFTLTEDPAEADRSLAVMLSPIWKKRPSGRDGSTVLRLPHYAQWDVPTVFAAALGQYLGGDPKHVGTVAQSALRDVLQQYREGALG